MFTGIIEEIGTIKALQIGGKSSILTIGGKLVFENLQLGDSIAVNGVCLTVRNFNQTTFTADVMEETLNRSTLGSLKNGSQVNLERALPVNGRFGGHLVSGHIDGTGEIIAIQQNENAQWYTIATTAKILHYIIEKGSIAIDGISLTVANINQQNFEVSIIPHTLQNTTLAKKKLGDLVNLENDLVGKYIEKLLQPSKTPKNQSKITPEFLGRFGY